MLSASNLKKTFDEFDGNNNGYLELNEVVKMAEKLSIPATISYINDFFKTIDTNHDGKVSFEEFYSFYAFGKGGENVQKIKKVIEKHIAVSRIAVPLIGISSGLLGQIKLGQKPENEQIKPGIVELLNFHGVAGEVKEKRSFIEVQLANGYEQEFQKNAKTASQILNGEGGFLYFALRTKEGMGPQLQEAIESFIDGLLMFLEEIGIPYQFFFSRDNLAIYQGGSIDEIIVSINITDNLAAGPALEFLSNVVHLTSVTALRASISIITSVDLIQLLNIGKKAIEIKEANGKSAFDQFLSDNNLLTLFFNNFKLDFASSCKKEEEEKLNQLFTEYGPDIIKSDVWFKVIQMVLTGMKRNSGKSFDLTTPSKFTEWLGKLKSSCEEEIPIVTDVLDIIGQRECLLSESQLPPVFQEIINSLKTTLIGDIEFGFGSDEGSLLIFAGSKGYSEVAHFVSERFEDH